jgi:hypothetical protein
VDVNDVRITLTQLTLGLALVRPADRVQKSHSTKLDVFLVRQDSTQRIKTNANSAHQVNIHLVVEQLSAVHVVVVTKR